MAPRAIISYDDTPGDHDALMLGRILADAGADLTLAYVRHCTQSDRTQEEREEQDAELLLERGTDWFSGLQVDTRVVVSPSTPEGLRRLAEEEDADIVVFGSDYRTAPGHIAPQRSTQALLEGGTTAVAIAPAGYHGEWSPRIHRIGVLAIPGDDATHCHRARARRQLRRDAHARRAPGRPAGRRLTLGGHARPRAHQRSRPERDRERHLPGPGHAARGHDRLPGRARADARASAHQRQDQVRVAELVP